MARCPKCSRPVGVVPTFYSRTGDIRYITVRCIKNCFAATTTGGITYPLGSGDWYNVSERDVVTWITNFGMTFEFQDINDAIYIQDKYNL